jgi:hypothetical protein
MEKDFNFNEDEIRQIDSARCRLFNITKNLGDVVSDKYIDELCEISSLLERGMQRHLDAKLKAFTRLSNYWSDVRDTNNFMSIWSIYDVGSDCNATVDEDLRVAFEQGAVLKYMGNVAKLETDINVTWLDVWKGVDQLIRMSEDHHHLYIEAFVIAGNEVKIITGS